MERLAVFPNYLALYCILPSLEVDLVVRVLRGMMLIGRVVLQYSCPKSTTLWRTSMRQSLGLCCYDTLLNWLHLVYTYPQQPSKKKNSTSHFRVMGLEAQKNSLISPNLEHHQKWSWFKTKGTGISIILLQRPLMSGSFALVVHFVWNASSSLVLDFVVVVNLFSLSTCFKIWA